MRRAKKKIRSPSKNSVRKAFFAGFHIGKKSKCKVTNKGKSTKKASSKAVKKRPVVGKSPRKGFNQKLFDLCLRNAHREMWDFATEAQMQEAARIDYKNALKDSDFRSWLQDEYGGA